MYKFYKDLDNYTIAVKNNEFEKRIYPQVPVEFLKKYSYIFKELKFIDRLLNSFNEKLFFTSYNYNGNEDISNEQYRKIAELASHIETNTYEYETYNINKYIIIDNDVFHLLHDIENYHTCSLYLKDLFPNFKEKIINIINHLEIIEEDIKKLIFKIDPDEYITYKFPNAFFITPNGYLYNSGGEKGHKVNNFINNYIRIVNCFNNNYSLEFDLINENESSNNKNYINEFEFGKGWLNCGYKPITIYTKEINYAEKINKIIMNNRELFKNFKLLDTERSYQTKLVELLKGFYDAEFHFFNYFNNNFKENPKEEYQELKNIIGNIGLYDEIVEILVRCIGFSKIESQVSKTITTTSLKPVTDFYNYLINGYDVVIIPKIINENSKIKEFNLNEIPIYTLKQIEKFEFEYPNKGKILIKK